MSTIQNRPYLVAIGGASCSGKTVVATALAGTFAKNSCVLLSLDSYYRNLSGMPPLQRAGQNFDEPDALEWPLIRAHVRSLSCGQTIHVPEYDFSTHLRTGQTFATEPRPVVILEGLFALHDSQVRHCCDLLVFVDAPAEVVLERRIARDVKERGRTRESIMIQFTSHVLPMGKKYVVPSRKYADIVVDGTAPAEESARYIAERIVAVKSGE